MHILLRIIRIAASLLLLGSIILPFIEFTYFPRMAIPELRFVECRIWSCRILCEGYGWPTRSEAWFSDYWLHDFFITEFGVSTVMMLLFTFQIIMLVISIALIFSHGNKFPWIPVILCPIIAGLMICSFIRFSSAVSPGTIVWINYLHGYWLTYFSEAVFVTNLIVTKVYSKRRILGFRD